MPRITEVQRQERKRAFLTAALVCLRQTSYARVTVDEICAAAGSSKGAFYLYFQTKQDLLFGLIDEQEATFERLIEGLDNQKLKPDELLERLASAQLREASDPAQLQLRADLWGIASTDAAVRDRLRAGISRRRQLLRGWIQQSIDAGSLSLDPELANAYSSILLALSDGLILHRGIDPRGFKWKNISSVLAALGATEGQRG
jgi:AcrR family transcriptional regulator